jgi:hypothetical protein
MSLPRRVAIAAVAVVFGVVGLSAGVAAVSSGAGSAGDEVDFVRPARGNLTAERLASWSGFPVYSVGAAFESLPISSINHVSVNVPYGDTGERPRDRPEFMRSTDRHQVELDYVSVMYGGCELNDSDDTRSCALPLEIQTWRGCNRTLSDIDYGPGIPVEYEPLSIGGATAVVFPDGRIEIYTGSSTIVVFGDSPDRASRAARLMSSANRLASMENPEELELRPAAAEVVTGTAARCGAIDVPGSSN